MKLETTAWHVLNVEKPSFIARNIKLKDLQVHVTYFWVSFL